MTQATTKDGLRITYTELFSEAADASRCLLIVPGFAQHSSSKLFTELSQGIAEPKAGHAARNVACMDLRGTGKSEGRFVFGKKEYLDVEAVWLKLRERFAHVDLMGFSLGAYSSLRATAETAIAPEHLYLVSCPTNVNEIIWRGALLSHTLNGLRDPRQRKKERHVDFAWGNPLSRKPNAKDFVARSNARKIHFMIGTDDKLVPPVMSKSIFVNAPIEKTDWLEVRDGRHAELIFFDFNDEFMKFVNHD